MYTGALRRIMRIRWDDYIRRAGLRSIEATLTNSQLRWAGHVARMHENTIPRMVFYGELADGTRRAGGQKLRYKDVAKQTTKSITIGLWQNLAHGHRLNSVKGVYRGSKRPWPPPP